MRLEEPDQAIEAYQEVLNHDAVNLDALRGLERLYEQRERWQDLLSVLEAEFEVVQTERERVEILTRLADMWEREFLKPERAAERLEQVLDIDPTDERALSGLARLYQQVRQWDSLIQTFERWVSATPDRLDRSPRLQGDGCDVRAGVE